MDSNKNINPNLKYSILKENYQNNYKAEYKNSEQDDSFSQGGEETEESSQGYDKQIDKIQSSQEYDTSSSPEESKIKDDENDDDGDDDDDEDDDDNDKDEDDEKLGESENISQSSITEDEGPSSMKSEVNTNQASTTTTFSPSYESRSSLDENPSSAAGLSGILNSTVVLKPINTVTNGTIPKSGKPLMAAITKKLNKPRGRPRRSKALVAMYQSQISENKVGIKLCIKKSDTAFVKTKSRKRPRKSKHKDDSEDEAQYKRRKRKEKANNNTDRSKKNDKDYKEPEEQSRWGFSLPEHLLFNIFNRIVQDEGSHCTLFRLGHVCTYWRKTSLSPYLWRNVDLTALVKEKHRTELRLKWFIDNRLSGCTELNLSNWKVSDIQCVLDKLSDACPDLIGITLAGWKGFTSDHLMYLVKKFKKLERIDLSSINVEMNPKESAVGLQSLCNAIQALSGRLTHLYLAHNRLAGIPQIITTLATHCPNLILLDLSNVSTFAISHGILHIEKLQYGCQKLKILRITNSHITLSSVKLQEQLDSYGFPELEELSVASLADESRLMNDDFLQRILKKSTKLKLLDVRGCARLTHDSLIRLPAWDLKHLFLSGCSVTRDLGSGLELIASKWAHSLIEFDLAWANVQERLDSALRALAEKGAESPLVHLNLCGSSVSEDAVKEILANCPHLNSINLSSCRGLPRGVKRLVYGPTKIQELRKVLKVKLKVEKDANEKAENNSNDNDDDDNDDDDNVNESK